MLQKISHAELKKRIAGGSGKEMDVKTSGILNYMFTTGMIEHIDKGMCTVSDSALEAITEMCKEPQSGDIVAVVNTGVYLLVDVVDNGKTVICAHVELNSDFVYEMPKFAVTAEPNDPSSSFNKFPINNVFVLRKGDFDMNEVKQRYEKFKQIWNIIRDVRKAKPIKEKGS